MLFSCQGYLVNWDIERQVWDHLFGKERLAVKYSLHFNFYHAMCMQHVCTEMYRYTLMTVSPSIGLTSNLNINAFSALTLLVGQQEGHLDRKKYGEMVEVGTS